MVTWDATNSSTCKPSMFSGNSSSCYVIPNYFIAVSLSINLVLGLPANCYILWLSVKEMIQGQSTEIFVFNAALVEVFFCSSYVFAIKQYFFNCADCRFGTYLPALVLLVGRPLFQSCICVERYIAVLHPVTFLKFKPMKYRIAISVTGWILTISSSLIVSLNIIELHSLVLPELLFFFSIKAFSCLMVLKALKRPGPSDDFKRKDGVNQDKLKAFRIIRIVWASAVFMYGPMIISLVLYYILDLKTFLLSWSGASCFGLMSGFVQPFLYLKRVGKLPFC
ncbi:mu-type opioid receptor-like [Megalobrama amblycephala]|uniref:mu-type opioid receptor-like n=1 Tax=Megalobrama amblycephala TaxID=75352 RepID=UPI002013E0CE|nr:mu-type opioid receptor-like [Megalobrama amblycephala]